MAGQLAIEATAPAAMLPVVDVALPDPGAAGMSLSLANRDLSGSAHSDVLPLPDGSVCAPPSSPEN
jgi:hypothetical protein